MQMPAGKKWAKVNHQGTGTADTGNFKSNSPQEIQTGMMVEHIRFGKGKVLNLEGEAPNIKATVFFKSTGQKQLLLKFAKLRIIRD